MVVCFFGPAEKVANSTRNENTTNIMLDVDLVFSRALMQSVDSGKAPCSGAGVCMRNSSYELLRFSFLCRRTHSRVLLHDREPVSRNFQVDTNKIDTGVGSAKRYALLPSNCVWWSGLP